MNTITKNMSMKLLLAVAFFVATIAEGQNDTTPTMYIGISVGLSAYTVQPGNNEIPVSSDYRINSEAGITGVFDLNNTYLIKTGLFYTYYRSPSVNNGSSYEEFLQLPFSFGFSVNTKRDKKLYVLAGPQISALIRRGTAQSGDDHYTMTNASFGEVYKLGIAVEAAFMRHGKFMNLFGFRGQMDIPGLVFNSNSADANSYISVGLFYNLNKKIRRKFN